MRAFAHLTTCRAIGMGGVGPIPWTAVASYADREGLVGDARDLFVDVVSEMDGAYLAEQRAERDGGRNHG